MSDSSPTSTAVTDVAPDEHVGVPLAVQTLVGFSMTAISPVVFGVALDLGGYGIAFPTLALGRLATLTSARLLKRGPDAPT